MSTLVKYTLSFVSSVWLLTVLSSVKSQNPKIKAELSLPEELQNSLFYIMRSINSSAIIYEVNTNSKGELNEDPVKIYWKNYATDSSTQSLTYIQKKYAYGIEWHMADVKSKMFYFNFVSYKEKNIYLVKSSFDKKYHAYCEVAGKFVILKSLFVQVEKGMMWTPKIKFIEIIGIDPSSNACVTEKIII